MGLSNPSGFTRTQKPIPPAGLLPAICYAIIDMGTHQESYKGNPPKNVQKVKFCFEFPTIPEEVFDPAKGPQRLSIMQDYNLSTGDKATIVKMLKQWRGVSTLDLAKDLPAYLGAPCTIQVVHTTKDGITYANIGQSGLMVMPPMQQLGQPKNTPVFFDTDKFSWQGFHGLWRFVQDKIRASAEWPEILQKFGPEPVQGNVQQQPVQQQQAYQQPVYPQQNYQMPNSFPPANNQHQFGNSAMQPNAQFQQQVPQFQQPVQQVPAPQQNLQQVPYMENPLQGTGIIVGNQNEPPAF